MVSYVGKRFHVDQEKIEITKADVLDSSCFWQVQFQAKNPQRSLTLYLSPDHQHLAPYLYDMRVDPRVVQREQLISVEKALKEGGSPRRGSPDGGITIVEFADFECPYCKQMENTLSKMLSEKASTAEVQAIYKNFPLEMHEWAMEAAALGECTHQVSPDAYWRLRDYLFSNQENLTKDRIEEHGMVFLRGLGGVSATAIESCLAAPGTRASIEEDLQLGKEYGVTSTPTLFINGEKIEGAKSPSQMDNILRRIRDESSGAPVDESSSTSK
jgi:protein-disulfide isomerase